MGNTSRTGLHPGILTLAVTAFAIGVAEFIIVGILPSISAAFDISLASAGSLVGLYALALAIGTPFIVIGLGRFARKPVLLGLIAAFLVGNLISALAPNYPLLLLGRIITALAHGSFFAIGATVAASLAREGQASKAIAVMFAGLTLAMVIGVPLGSYLGNALGWRLPFYAVSLLALLALLATAAWLPRQAASHSGNALAQLSALGSPAIWAMMAVTVLGFGASFSAFTFITPILTDITGFSATGASSLLLVFGVATMIGNLLGGRLSDSLGWERTLRLLFVALALVLAALALALPYKSLKVLTVFVWGIVAFGMTPAFQTGMLATARLHTPRAVDFASGLNISAFNLGITLGERAGSLLVESGQLALTPWAGVGAALLVHLPLAWLLWRRRQASVQAC